jgi:hypothetical protein
MRGELFLSEPGFLFSRHCEARSNRELYRADLLIGDCFVPRNDAFEETDDRLQRLYIIMEHV